MRQVQPAKTSRVYNVLSAAAAFVMWGGWAYYINSGFGESTRIVSAIAQGSASFVITLFMVHAVTWLFHRMPNSVLKLILPAVLTVSFTGSCLATLHFFVGTPRILQTIAPALTVAFLFCLYTTIKLKKHLNKFKTRHSHVGGNPQVVGERRFPRRRE